MPDVLHGPACFTLAPPMRRFQFVPAGDPQHLADWLLLRERRTPLAAAHAPPPAQVGRPGLDLWCRVLRENAELQAGAVISISRSRKLPLLRVGRIHFAGTLLDSLGPDDLPGFLEALTHHRHAPSLLSVHVYSVHEAERAGQEQRLLDAGFERDAEPRTFHHTLLVSVAGSADYRLSRLSYAARRGIRQVVERGFRVAPVEDVAAADRLAWLHSEAHRRTGAQPRAVDFARAIEAARHDPESSVVLGIQHPDRPVETALVGFAHGLATGSSVIYGSAGTERAGDIGSTPLSYGLVARLLDWTAERGFDLFDFGGITPADQPEHPLAGISEFKRKFRGRDAHVASDFRVALRPMGAAMLRALELPARIVRAR